MFDIGFAELMVIGVVGLLVIGPERLPETIRTVSAWINRFRRGFESVKADVQRELHNDAVLQDLKKSAEQVHRDFSDAAEPLKAPVEQAKQELQSTGDALKQSLQDGSNESAAPETDPTQ